MLAKLRLQAKAWLKNIVSVKGGSAILSAFGALWLLIEISTFYFQETAIPAWLRAHWWLFAIAGVVISACVCFPRLSVSYKLNGRDVTISICINDMFSVPGALIVGSNSTFDTEISPRLIATKSVQGQFTKMHYTHESQLDAEIEASLRGTNGVHLTDRQFGKSTRYPRGTVARLNPQGRTAYLLAIADINPQGVAESNFEYLQVALAELWIYVGSRGLKEPLVMPVLGTGLSRLPQTREQVVREIINSFVAACSERVFADHITIVLSPSDVKKHKISFDDIASFLRHTCVYTDFSTNAKPAVGQPT
jgi:hypothetical protein